MELMLLTLFQTLPMLMAIRKRQNFISEYIEKLSANNRLEEPSNF